MEKHMAMAVVQKATSCALVASSDYHTHSILAADHKEEATVD